MTRRLYNFQIGASIAWVTFLVVFLVWGGAVLYVKNQAAETICETTARTYGLNDGCQ